MKNLLLLLLFVVFSAGFFLFTELLFGDDDLISIESQVIEIYTFTKTDTLKNKKVHHFAYLCFYLSDDKRQYTLRLSIDSAKESRNVFSGIESDLKDTRNVVVWVRRAEIGKTMLKVYRLYADSEKIFEIKKKPADTAFLTLLLSSAILIFCLIYYCYYRYKNIDRF